MKKLIILLSIAILIASCTKKELSREEAFQLIKQDKQYLDIFDYDIFCADPEFAKKVLDAGLEKRGLLTVQRTQKLKDVGKPLIHFTDKAKPYLLPVFEEDKSLNIQKVKLAEEELLEVTGIKMLSDGKSAKVEYITAYKNITPFAVLVNTDFKEKDTNTVSFALYDDGWRLEE